MEIKNTKNYEQVPSIMLIVYGMGGVGKSTFASTFPKPLMLDFENGAKYFKDRGIEIDVANCKEWLSTEDKKELAKMIENYETVIIDPIGEAMEKLINGTSVSGSKFRQSNGDLTIAGWGEVKKQMKNFVKWLRDTGKNVVIVAHVDEKEDEGRIIKRPLVATKISHDLINMFDIVAYYQIINHDGEEKRVLTLDSGDDKYVSKDRTGKLGKYAKPDYKFLKEKLNEGQENIKDEKLESESKKEVKEKNTEESEEKSKEENASDTNDIEKNNPFNKKNDSKNNS